MQIEVLTVSPFQQNARILMCKETKDAIIVDPGDEADRILQKVEEMGANVSCIWATHGHIDHVAAVYTVKEKLKVPFLMHKDDMPMLENLPLQGAQFGLPITNIPTVDKYIEEGDTLTFGKCSCSVLFTPGHSPGSVGFLFGKDLIAGDVLFYESIGRTDLPGGSFAVLKKSILEKLYVLPDDTIIHPGHGPNTTIGHEKQNNPFVSMRN